MCVEIYALDITQSSPFRYVYRIAYNIGGGAVPTMAQEINYTGGGIAGEVIEVAISAGDSAEEIAEATFIAIRDANPAHIDVELGSTDGKGLGHPGEHKDAVIITNRIGGAVGFGTTSASNFNDHVMGIWMRQDGSQPIHFGFMQRGGDISNIQVTNSGSGYSSSPAITPLSSTVKKKKFNSIP